MIHLIIGHRGTGKSHWLKIISQIHKKKEKKIFCFDLDKEIESSSKKSIQDLFKEGELIFREWEQNTFKKIVQSFSQKDSVFISVGAGFSVQKTENQTIIHLARMTDKDGRIFFDRPALIPNTSSMEESMQLYDKRNSYYLKNKNEMFYRLEHFKEPQFSDYLFFGLEKISDSLFSLRLEPSLLPIGKENSFLQKRLGWGIRFFELHDSYRDDCFIDKVKQIIPLDKILFSSQNNHHFKSIKDKIHWSWDLDLGEPPEGVTILSLHKRGEKSLQTLLKNFSSYKNYHLKLAIEIFNLEELWQAYLWYKEDPKNRTFLPRSEEGRWKWFRNAFGSQMFLNFIQEGESKIKDQPLFCEAIHFKGNHKERAGVVGFPIHFSATPSEHNAFFYKERSIPVFPIPLKEEEMTKENIKIFQNLGFVFLAITSPLKQKAFYCADDVDGEAQHLKSVNTFILDRNQCRAYNTDQEGLKELKKHEGKSIAVWGGGGVRAPLQSILPKASFFSARTGDLIKRKEVLPKEQHSFSPEIVIWAVGAQRMTQACRFPPRQWQPHEVIDLNYMENSPGREYAKRVQAMYRNGDFLFKKQAQQQRDIYLNWEKK